MQKEILTTQAIQYDLRKMIRGHIIAVAIFSVFFALFTWLLVAVIEDGLKWYKAFFAILNAVFFGSLPVLFLYGTIASILEIHKLRSLCKRPGSIVKDRLVGKEVKEHLHRWRYYETYNLRFASYGEFAIPGVNYEWSDLYYMDSSALFMHAECDDEFYLVLSKPNTGKILLAYNAKMFDYQETPCNPTYPGV